MYYLFYVHIYCLQVLQRLAIRCRLPGHLVPGLPQDISQHLPNIFTRALEKLINILIFPSAFCEYGLSNDRSDAFANAFLAVIAIYPDRYNCIIDMS
jgi:hypothetical protein